MAELATLARPYAEAYFQVATEHGDTASAGEQLAALAAVAANPAMRSFADRPKVGAAQVFDVITSVAVNEFGDPARNLLKTVIDNGRLDVLPEISTQFHALVAEHSGVADAVVYSAFPIGADALADLVATLEKRFARKLDATVVVQPELIGGVRVVVGDEVLDTSIKARLERMKAALTA